MITNYELKLKAREALRNNWQVALMVALIASLPSLISQVVAIMTQSNLTNQLNQLLMASSNDVSAEKMLEIVSNMNHTPTLLLNLFSAIVSPFLTLGFLHYTFRLLGGEKDMGVEAVLSRKGSFFKAIGLNLMIALRVFLWMLAGVAVEVLGMVMALMFPETMDVVGTVVMFAGMAAMLVLGVRAALHYAMADRILAEEPSKGINQCIRESVDMMSHRKMLLFSLEVSFILYHLGITLLESFVLGMVGTVMAATVSMVLSFVLNVYMQTSVSAFYLVYRAESSI